MLGKNSFLLSDYSVFSYSVVSFSLYFRVGFPLFHARSYFVRSEISIDLLGHLLILFRLT
jgi:hypothetical protein